MKRLLAAALLALAAASAQALPPPVAGELARPRLAGEGRFSWFGLAIYEARLYVGAQGYRPQAPEAAAFALELHYLRSLSGQRIAERSIDEIAKLGVGTAAQRQTWLAALRTIFPDVENGTRLTGLYLPQRGARFYRGADLIGEVADPLLARAFFAIWLDPATSAPELRARLLKEAAPQ
ncbi:chalcone isomerase family protein [Massilia sp. TS11]|uniref:chalcone isomerase family protein n=1 Tax=Massilia sp. TS11 TaxID=2908003 RepID=UPI001EDA1E04|nr:chalcone isomerase family protein [Massilia sp. TS11]MCG2585336.1 chalcone isomerase family protein [Massilia sp. TS11]